MDNSVSVLSTLAATSVIAFIAVQCLLHDKIEGYTKANKGSVLPSNFSRLDNRGQDAQLQQQRAQSEDVFNTQPREAPPSFSNTQSREAPSGFDRMLPPEGAPSASSAAWEAPVQPSSVKMAPPSFSDQDLNNVLPADHNHRIILKRPGSLLSTKNKVSILDGRGEAHHHLPPEKPLCLALPTSY